MPRGTKPGTVRGPYLPWFVYIRRKDWVEFPMARFKTEATAREFAVLIANEMIQANLDGKGDTTVALSLDGMQYASARGTMMVIVAPYGRVVDPKDKYKNDYTIKPGNRFTVRRCTTKIQLSLEEVGYYKGRDFYLDRNKSQGDGNRYDTRKGYYGNKGFKRKERVQDQPPRPHRGSRDGSV